MDVAKNVEEVRRHAQLFVRTDTESVLRHDHHEQEDQQQQHQLQQQLQTQSQSRQQHQQGRRGGSYVNIVHALRCARDDKEKVEKQIEKRGRDQTGEDEEMQSLKRRKTRFDVKYSELLKRFKVSARCMDALASFHSVLASARRVGIEAFERATENASQELLDTTWGPYPEGRIPHPFGFYRTMISLAQVIYSLRIDGHDVTFHSMETSEVGKYTIETDKIQRGKLTTTYPHAVAEQHGGEYEIFIETASSFVDIKVQILTGFVKDASIAFGELEQNDASKCILNLIRKKKTSVLCDVFRSLCCKTRITQGLAEFPKNLSEYLNEMFVKILGCVPDHDGWKGNCEGFPYPVTLRHWTEGPALVLDSCRTLASFEEHKARISPFRSKQDTIFPISHQGFVFRNIAPFDENGCTLISRNEEILAFNGFETKPATEVCTSLSVECIEPILVPCILINKLVETLSSVCKTGTSKPVILIGNREYSMLSLTEKHLEEVNQVRKCETRVNDCICFQFDNVCGDETQVLAARRVFGIGFQDAEKQSKPDIETIVHVVKHSHKVLLRSWRFNSLLFSLLWCDGKVYGSNVASNSERSSDDLRVRIHTGYFVEQFSVFVKLEYTTSEGRHLLGILIEVTDGSQLSCRVYAPGQDSFLDAQILGSLGSFSRDTLSSDSTEGMGSELAHQFWSSFEGRKQSPWERELSGVLQKSLERVSHIPFAFYALLDHIQSG